MPGEFYLPADPTAPALARACLAATGLSEPVFDDAALLTSEAVSNAIRHAGMRHREDIVVRVDWDEMVYIEVLDAGEGFAPGARLSPGTDQAAGWGLFLIDRLSKSWGVEREGSRTKVWFELSTA